jgi:hypothetical protein
MGNNITACSFGPSKQVAAESLVSVLEIFGYKISSHPNSWIGIERKILELSNKDWILDIDEYGRYLILFKPIIGDNLQATVKYID